MKKPYFRLAVTLLVASACGAGVHAQAPGPAADPSPIAKSTAPFSPHDLDGLWMTATGLNSGSQIIDPNAHPPFTPWAQARFDASFPSLGPRDVPGKENDPILRCDPDGVPKILGSPHPFEMFVLRDRVIQIFEKHHDWREIWMDGRKLPDDPPQLTWNGYSVGRWEGDTFIVESNGFNDIHWLDYWGDPHSDAMHLTEYYTRVDHDTLSISVSIDDPKAYTAKWVGKPHVFTLKPNWTLQEYYCINEELTKYDKDIRLPSGVDGNKATTGNKTTKSSKTTSGKK
jgi:hypothetical protein